MKRIILIILWVFLFLIVGSVIAGLGIGILIGFTDFDIEGNAMKLGAISNLISLVSILIGLYFGITEKLPGTKKAA